MSEAVVITSRRNRRVVEARKLDQRKHRWRQGRFLVEGLQLLHMALEGGWRPREVFYERDAVDDPSADGVAELMAAMQAADADVVQVSSHVMEALADRDAPQGVVATFEIDLPDVEQLRLPPRSESDALVLVIDRLQDPGNLGTLIRTADAVGAAAVVLVEPCVDVFDPKTVRGTMGSLFNVPVAATEDVARLFDRLADGAIRAVAADAHEGELWGDRALDGRVALVLGNEARGLSDDVAAHVSAMVRLPVPGGAESLNVAVAGGVLMYGWLRRSGRAG